MGHPLQYRHQIFEASQVAVELEFDVVLQPVAEARCPQEEVGLSHTVDLKPAVLIRLIVSHAPHGEIVTQTHAAAMM
eukprot:6592917-Pyramimonas_sp.AAC.1